MKKRTLTDLRQRPFRELDRQPPSRSRYGAQTQLDEIERGAVERDA